MNLSALWSKLLGKPTSDEALLALELERLTRLRVATERMKKKQEIHRQLLEAQKEAKDLEEGLGVRSRLVGYVVGLAVFLIMVIMARSCVGC